MDELTFKPRNAAFGAATPEFYRYEVQQVLEVRYPGTEAVPPTAVIEADVGQRAGDGVLPEGAVVVGPFWALYGRTKDGPARHIVDLGSFEEAVDLVLAIGGDPKWVPPGPAITCHGRPVVFENDGNWDTGHEMAMIGVIQLCRRQLMRALDTGAHVVDGPEYDGVIHAELERRLRATLKHPALFDNS